MDEDEVWDVIIIGGGPAGSTTARYIAKSGHKVLVVDGRNPIGSPLQCGELVPTNDEMRRLCPNVPDMDDLFRTSNEAISRRTEEMHLVPPSGKPLKYKFEGLILNRVRHDEELVKLAKSYGAKYLIGKRVLEVEGEYVILKCGMKLRAKIIVGAGGHNDPLRKKFWSDKSLNIPVKFVLMDGTFSDSVELHFGSIAPGGYAWMFPKKNGANIGLGIQRSFSKGKSINDFTDEFVSNYKGNITFKGAGSLPMSGTINSFVNKNYLIVGDAAGMVLPSNGAGITIAMVGGRIAGQVISEHLSSGMPLTEYEIRWKHQMGKVMRNSKRAFKLGSIIFRLPDWMINILFNRLTKPFIWNAITCRSFFKLTKY
jgi:digeranylgeranylglycerophospholipid reductase